ncbi:hypothetical protein ACVWZ6_001644 [Bradyrhizobium sp. GM6.1]
MMSRELGCTNHATASAPSSCCITGTPRPRHTTRSLACSRHPASLCLQLSLPYHHERKTPGVGFARELVCENLGLTIRSNRQAILDARTCLAWLEWQGFRRLGIIGVSVGSSISSIVAALDSRVSAAVLILMADDFAEVVWTGSATAHVKSSLERRFAFEEVQAAWAVISPATYAQRLSRRLNHALIISGRHDAVFIPQSTRRYVDRLSTHVAAPRLDPLRLRTLYAAAIPIFGADRHEYHQLFAATALTRRRAASFILWLRRSVPGS